MPGTETGAEARGGLLYNDCRVSERGGRGSVVVLVLRSRQPADSQADRWTGHRSVQSRYECSLSSSDGADVGWNLVRHLHRYLDDFVSAVRLLRSDHSAGGRLSRRKPTVAGTAQYNLTHIPVKEFLPVSFTS